MIGGGPIMEDEGNLTVQNPSGREPFSFQSLYWFKSYSNVKWLVSNGMILSSGRVASGSESAINKLLDQSSFCHVKNDCQLIFSKKSKVPNHFTQNCDL